MTNQIKPDGPDLAERIKQGMWKEGKFFMDIKDEEALKRAVAPIEAVLEKAKQTAIEAIGMNESPMVENERIKAELAELRGKNRVVCDPPNRCPITDLPFFMLIEDEDGNALPTYGGPYDSYTIPERDNEGNFIRRRYDHDEGGWVDEWENICIKVVDEDHYHGMEDELAELRAFAERFPKTADGVRISVGMVAWVTTNHKNPRYIYAVGTYRGGVAVSHPLEIVSPTGISGVKPIYHHSHQIYSTQAAMLAAKEGK